MDPFNEESKMYYENYSNEVFEPCKKSIIKAFRYKGNQIMIIYTDGRNESVPNCYYSKVLRVSDSEIKFEDELKFCENSISCNKTFNDVVSIRIRCYDSPEMKEALYEELIPIIPEINTNKTNNNNVPNILLLIMDSTSRLNFERHCPKTLELLKKKQFYRLYGYTRLGENTYPNMVPFYTGYFVDDLYIENVTESFDDWPFIWKVSSARNVTKFNTII